MHTVIILLAQGQHAFSAETCCELVKGRTTHAAAAPHVQNYPQYTSPSSPPEGTKPKAGEELQRQLLALGTSLECSQRGLANQQHCFTSGWSSWAKNQ